MQPNDICTAQLALAQCRAILGGQYDPMRSVWEASSERRRALFLSIAGQRPHYVHRTWLELPVETRGLIRGGVRHLKCFLNSLPAESFLDPCDGPSEGEEGAFHG